MGKGLITVADVVQAAKSGNRAIPPSPDGFIITPGAVDKAAELGVTLPSSDQPGQAESSAACVADASQAQAVVSQVCSMVENRLPTDLDSRDLEKLVREVVTSKLCGQETVTATEGERLPAGVGEVTFVRSQRLLNQGAGPVPVDEKVLVANAFKGAEGSRLAGGFMEWEKASFRRTVEHPEMAVVVSGELHLTVGGKTITASAGDMVYFPQGAKVIYSTPSRVKLACVNSLK